MYYCSLIGEFNSAHLRRSVRDFSGTASFALLGSENNKRKKSPKKNKTQNAFFDRIRISGGYRNL